MRFGLFGGSFDPVHLGHLELARCCEQQAGLDEVWFIPAATQPLKRHGPVASDAQRMKMLRLAVADRPTWKVSRMELERGGVSYTVDTLLRLHDHLPEDDLFFMMGADALRDFPTWHKPREICQLATPVVVARAGQPLPDFDALLPVCSPERVEEIRAMQVTMPEVPIASSSIRSMIAQGDDVSSMVPSAVLAYIQQENLYR
jgi:nicotinate-nucleotide adenylyltransferase